MEITTEADFIKQLHANNPGIWSRVRKRNRDNNWKPHLVIGISRENVNRGCELIDGKEFLNNSN